MSVELGNHLSNILLPPRDGNISVWQRVNALRFSTDRRVTHGNRDHVFVNAPLRSGP